MNHRDEPRTWDEQAIRNSSTYHKLWWLTNLSNHTTLHMLHFLWFCEWRKHLHASFYIASFIPHPPTSPTTFTHLSHSFTRSNDSWAKSGISCFHVACMQGHCSAQKQGHLSNLLWRTWHSLSSAQLSLHLWGEPKFTPLSFSFHPYLQQFMNPNGVVWWLPSSTRVTPLEANNPNEIVFWMELFINYKEIKRIEGKPIPRLVK